MFGKAWDYQIWWTGSFDSMRVKNTCSTGVTGSGNLWSIQVSDSHVYFELLISNVETQTPDIDIQLIP